jgi:hypothetical protein
VLLRRGSPARKLESTAAYRLEIDKGGGREVPEESPDKIILNVPLTLGRGWLKGRSFLLS